MRVVRWLTGLSVCGIGAVAALAIAARFSDGPIGLFAGGPFRSGELISGPEGEADTSESPVFVWQFIHDGVQAALAARTIADLCREAAERGIARADAEPAMYQI